MSLTPNEFLTAVSLFAKANREDLDRLREMFKRRASTLQTEKTKELFVSQKVFFETKNGQKVVGVIEKINKKTVIVREKPGHRWKVSPSLIQAA